MTQAATGGVKAEPKPMPPIAMPIPKPRESAGTQLATARLNEGSATASPMPKANRTVASAPTIPTASASDELAASAVHAVQTDHHTRAAVSTTLTPQRSASHPPGI